MIDKDRKQRESIPAPDLRINGERDINDACRYLGYWGTVTGNGDFPPLFLRSCVRFRDLLWPCLQVNQALLKAVKRWVGDHQWQESDDSRSARRKHFVGSTRRASKKNNSMSSDVFGQSESALRRTCKWRSRHPSRQGYFRQRCSHRMAQQDISSSLHMSFPGKEVRWAGNKSANKDDDSM